MLEQELAVSRAEIAALRTACDAALRLSAWGGLRVDVEQRLETP